VRALARGARRSRRRFGSALQPFQLVQLVVTPPGRGGLWLLQEAEVLRPFSVAQDPLRYGAATYATELVREFLPEGVPDPRALGLLVELLVRLDRGQPPLVQLVGTMVSILELAGVLPPWDRCVSCGRVAPEGKAGRFDVRRGLVCSRCGQGGVLLRGVARQQLAAAAVDQPAQVSVDDAGVLVGALCAFAHHQLGREPHSVGLLRQFLPSPNGKGRRGG
jgi:DNA repair protein RecO (recombination protein O)